MKWYCGKISNIKLFQNLKKNIHIATVHLQPKYWFKKRATMKALDENKDETPERESLATENDFKILSENNPNKERFDSKHDEEEPAVNKYDDLTLSDDTRKAGLWEKESRKDDQANPAVKTHQ